MSSNNTWRKMHLLPLSRNGLMNGGHKLASFSKENLLLKPLSDSKKKDTKMLDRNNLVNEAEAVLKCLFIM